MKTCKSMVIIVLLVTFMMLALPLSQIDMSGGGEENSIGCDTSIILNSLSSENFIESNSQKDYLNIEDYTTEIFVDGSSVSKTGIQTAIDTTLETYNDQDKRAGDVKLILNPTNSRVIINSSLDPVTYIDLPIDKGIDSFTVTTTKDGATNENPVILFVELGSAGYIFANGIPFIVKGPISLGGDIYGGTNGKDLTVDTNVIYDGAAAKAYNRTAIYGGSLNGNIEGSTNITIRGTNLDLNSNSGTNFSVTGGGDASGTGKSANVSGDTNIQVYGNVLNVQGGGNADSGGEANITGDVYISFFEGSNLVRKVYGGGSAINYTSYPGTTSTANVSGTVHISIFGPLTQYRYDGDYIVGGGYAKTYADYTTGFAESSAVADVKNVEIKVYSNITTNAEVNTDRCIVGGGDIDGPVDANPNAVDGVDICQANVTGNIYIEIGSGIKLNKAVIGGGSCFGGHCDVDGTVTIHIGDNATIGGITGGGTINCNTRRPSTADVGNVVIEIGDNVTSTGNVIGGGATKYISSNYKPDGGHSNIEGQIQINIGNNFNGNNWFFGGGLAGVKNTSASVKGDISTTIGGGCILTGQFVGGGESEAENAVASVGGNITTTISGEFKCSYFTSAGRVVNGATGSATVGSLDSPSTVSTTFHGNESDTASFSGLVTGAGRVYAANSNATVYGDTNLTFDNIIPNQNIYGGGYSNAKAEAKVTGTASLTMRNIEFSKYCYGGGYVGSAEANADVGSVKIMLDNVKTSSSSWIFGGGYAVDNSTSQIMSDADINIINSKITNDICPAGHANSKINNANITFIGSVDVAHINKLDTTTMNGRLSINVGDGETETDVNIKYIYETNSDVHVYNNATLTHNSDGSNKLFWYVRNLQIDDSGELKLSSFDESISGDFTGGGTIQLNSDRMLTINGTASNNTTLLINGDPLKDFPYVSVEDTSGDGKFSYTKVDESSGTRLGLKETVNGAADWMIITEYKITVSLDSSEESQNIYIYNGGEYTPLERDGENFTGYAESGNYQIFVGDNLDSLVPVGSVELSDSKVDLEYVEVTFDSNGHAFTDDTAPSAQIISVNTQATKPEDPSSADHVIFKGWYTETACIYEWNFNNSISESKTLYAKWEAITFTISYELNGGTNNPDNPTGYTIDTETITLNDPMKLGYTFKGWFIDAECTTPFNYEKGTTMGDIMLYAKWVSTSTPGPTYYRVEYNANGGEGNVPKTEIYFAGESVVVKSSGLEKEGCSFKGWCDSVTQTTYQPDEKFRMPSRNVCLTAVWELIPLETVAVTFCVDGKEYAKIILDKGSSLGEKFSEIPVKEGYVFVGWYCDPEFNNKYDSGSVLVNDLTLYAKWSDATSATNEYGGYAPYLWIIIIVLSALIIGVYLVRKRKKHE